AAAGEEVHDGERGGDDRGRQRVAEQVRARAVAQQLDDLAAGGDEPARGAAEGLAEGAGEDVDPAHGAVVLVAAAAGRADEAGRVAVVDHDHGAVLVGEVANRGDAGDVAVHAEDAVGGDHAQAG